MKLAGPVGAVGFGGEGQPGGLQPALELADVGESVRRLRVCVPARIERQDVALEHALEQADRDAAVAQDQPVLPASPPKTSKPSFS